MSAPVQTRADHIQLLLDHLQRADQTLTAALNEAARSELRYTADLIDGYRADLANVRQSLVNNYAPVLRDATEMVR